MFSIFDDHMLDYLAEIATVVIFEFVVV
jgi:hypothetical protein